jgi:WD40 repeat protein
MADPIAVYKQQQALAKAKLGQGVDMVESRTSSKDSLRPSRRPSKLANLLDESPPMSPATMKRRESKEKEKNMKSDDVLGMLGIKKTDDMLDFEKRKAEAMMAAVGKFASILQRKKSPAELSSSKWKAVAKLFNQGKLTFEALRLAESGGGDGDDSKKVSWSNVKIDTEEGQSATIRCQFEPQYNEFSKVSTLLGDKACVATRINGSDSYVACAYFDGCITVFDIDEQAVFNTQDVGCLKQMPSGDWKMTQQDDDTVAVMNLRWCPPPNDVFMCATATGGIVAMWQVSQRVQELAGCVRDPDDNFYGLDWTLDGTKICVGGAGKKVKVFDPHADMSCIVAEFEIDHNTTSISGHSNRITSIKTSPREVSLLCSASLDHSVQIWDIRQKSYVSACPGALVDGDALDIDQSGRYILTAGANHEGARIDIWDIRNCQKVLESRDAITGSTPTCVSFSKGTQSKYIHVGGTTAHCASVYRAPPMAGSTPTGQLLDQSPMKKVAHVSNIDMSFRCLGCAHRSNTVAYGNNDGLVTIVDYALA